MPSSGTYQVATGPASYAVWLPSCGGLRPPSSRPGGAMSLPPLPALRAGPNRGRSPRFEGALATCRRGSGLRGRGGAGGTRARREDRTLLGLFVGQVSSPDDGPRAVPEEGLEPPPRGSKPRILPLEDTGRRRRGRCGRSRTVEAALMRRADQPWLTAMEPSEGIAPSLCLATSEVPRCLGLDGIEPH